MAELNGHTLAELTAHHNKTYGCNTCVANTNIDLFNAKLPTGIFALDLALNGGLPLNRLSCFKGLESGGKSSAAMNVAAIGSLICWRCFEFECTCSLPHLDLKTFWCDVEGTFDHGWAEAIGMKPENYVVAYGDDGEQCADMVESAIRATDCGLVVVDSLAAMTPSKIIEGSSYNQYVGVDPRFITPFIKRIRSRLVREAKLGHPVVCIIINQARFKIGEMFSNPVTMSGGQALKHETSLWVNFAKKAQTEAEKKLADDTRHITRAQRHSFTIEKHKQAILFGYGEYVRCKEDVYSGTEVEYKKGDVLDHKSTMKYGKDYNVVKQDNNKWSYGNISGSQKTIIEEWKKNEILYLKAQRDVINAARQIITPIENV